MKKVKSREKFRVKAETWNSFINAAEFVKQRQADMKSQNGRRDTKSGTVMLRNGTDEALGQFAAVEVDAEDVERLPAIMRDRVDR